MRSTKAIPTAETAAQRLLVTNRGLLHMRDSEILMDISAYLDVSRRGFLGRPALGSLFDFAQSQDPPLDITEGEISAAFAAIHSVAAPEDITEDSSAGELARGIVVGLAARLVIVGSIATAKQTLGMDVHNPGVERQKIDDFGTISQANGLSITPVEIESVFPPIFQIAKNRQQVLREQQPTTPSA